ncbi:hypothetical protein SAMN04487999_3274 [Leeuwenhoekiella palythoae]|uniref:Uncharacterized protein n=1 Tax=Leeuwenhoekiella palythoae TaxID=573501 RepID=A0A1M5ZMU0_9FLAO|nr:hypothetical protein SAMN04487999_3274 [Leeuwenhoekiella palythoae]
MINAAITPGIQPQNHSRVTNNTEPHPLSRTDKGGKKMAINALKKLIFDLIYDD